jgi:DNA polymerase III epsilon subunit-like protein
MQCSRASKVKGYERYLRDKTKPYIAFDTEPTGLYPWRGSRIIEVGALKARVIARSMTPA